MIKFFVSIIEKFGITKRSIFPALAIVLLAITVWVCSISIDFLGTNLNTAMAPIKTQPVDLKFDIEGFEKLNLEKPSQ